MNDRFEDKLEGPPTPWSVESCIKRGNQKYVNRMRKSKGIDLKCCHNGDGSALLPICALPGAPAAAVPVIPVGKAPAVPAAKAPAAKGKGGFDISIDRLDKHTKRIRCATKQSRKQHLERNPGSTLCL